MPVALPALTRALKLQDKAARSASTGTIRARCCDKIREEADEIEAALDDGDESGAAAEVGDFCLPRSISRAICAPIPEGVVAATKPEIRAPLCRDRARAGREGKTPQDATLAEMDALWDEAKGMETRSSDGYVHGLIVLHQGGLTLRGGLPPLSTQTAFRGDDYDPCGTGLEAVDQRDRAWSRRPERSFHTSVLGFLSITSV